MVSFSDSTAFDEALLPDDLKVLRVFSMDAHRGQVRIYDLQLLQQALVGDALHRMALRDLGEHLSLSPSLLRTIWKRCLSFPCTIATMSFSVHCSSLDMGMAHRSWTSR